MEDMSDVKIIEGKNGEQYADRSLYRIKHNPKAEPIRITTLTSLVEYLQQETESLEQELFVHVISPTKVSVYSELDAERVREHLVDVNAKLPEFNFDVYGEKEMFCIALQSKFVPNKDRELLLKFAGTVERGTIEQYGDDGISQKATIKTGIASKTEAIVPNPVKLIPYRTFLEVAQPESDFIFRMRGNITIECALFEADGGAWKIEAMKNIAGFLKEELEDLPRLKIIV